MANIRCKQCVFKDTEGNKYPCIICSEIVAYKATTNYFKSIYANENNTVMPEVKKRLKDRLYKLTPCSKRILSRFSIIHDETTMLTAFVLNKNKDIVMYQITDRNSELNENIILVDKYLFEEFKYFYDKNIKNE